MDFFLLSTSTIFITSFIVNTREKKEISIFERKKSSNNIILRKWNELDESDKTLYSIIFINFIVFASWNIKGKSHNFCVKHFTHNPITLKSYTLLTSCFSHQSTMHFVFNMIGLYSFGSALHKIMGKEQFLATYLSIGIGSSLISHLAKVFRGRYINSIGASGALMGLLAISN